VHLDPALNVQERKDFLEKVRRVIVDSDDVFLAGDFNFLVPGDKKHMIQQGVFISECPTMGKFFQDRFVDFTELYQPEPTRRAMRNNTIHSASRLDRIFTNMHHILLDTCDISALTLWPVCTYDASSDHVPVAASIKRRPNKSQGRVNIPSWVTCHPAYASELEGLFDKLGAQGDPCTAILKCKTLMKMAAQRVLKMSVTRGANTCAEKLYWSYKALHNTVRGNVPSRRQQRSDALQAYPLLRQWVNAQGETIDEQGLLDHIAELARMDITAQLEELESRSDLPEYQKSNAQARLHRRAKAYSKKGRQTKLAGIRDSQGQAVLDSNAAVELLRQHWQPTFEEKAISNSWLKLVEPYIQTCAGQLGMDEPVTFDEFTEVLDKLVDSGVGPDGLPYSGWSRACQSVKKVLYAHYMHFLMGGELYEGANCSTMFFLPKGEDAQDGCTVTRHPKDTRPLCLSNTDSKILAMCVNQQLSKLAECTVCDKQRGFMPGRKLADNILEVEAHGIINAALGKHSAGIMLFDFRAAFPSLQHKFLFYVLKRMGIPRRMLNVLVKLYKDCGTIIVYNGGVFQGLIIKSGIKQGCPLSGTLFALALDPFIRLLLSRIEHPHDTLTAFADDLAMVCGDMKARLGVIMKLFDGFGKASGLWLNMAKCVLIMLHASDADIEEMMQWLTSNISMGGDIQVATKGKYLGINIGPGASISSWDAPLHKFKVRVASIKQEGLGMMQSLIDYRTFAFPVLAYVMQFQKAPRKVVKAQQHAIQQLLRSPYNAIPFDMVTQLKVLGFHAEYPDLEVANQSAMLRCASASHIFEHLAEQLRRLPEHEDACFRNPAGKWHSESCIGQLAVNLGEWREAVDLKQHAEENDKLQALAYRVICAATSRKSPVTILQERLAYWCKNFNFTVVQADMDAAVANVQATAANLPPYIAAAVLKTIANAWCTSARFHGESVLPCFFCATEDGDDLLHMFGCSVVKEMVVSSRPEMSFWAAQIPPFRVPTMLYHYGSTALRTRIATMVEAWYYTYNWLRHKHKPQERSTISEMFRARMMFSCRHARCIREAFRGQSETEDLSSMSIAESCLV